MDPHASEAANAQNCSEMCAQDQLAKLKGFVLKG